MHLTSLCLLSNCLSHGPLAHLQLPVVNTRGHRRTHVQRQRLFKTTKVAQSSFAKSVLYMMACRHKPAKDCPNIFYRKMCVHFQNNLRINKVDNLFVVTGFTCRKLSTLSSNPGNLKWISYYLSAVHSIPYLV